MIHKEHRTDKIILEEGLVPNISLNQRQLIVIQ